MKRLLVLFLLVATVSASVFNVTWTPVKEDIVNKEYIITIQNLDTDMRTVDVESFFEDTNFDTSKIQDVEFYEQAVKPVTKEIKHYKTIQVSETVSHIDNKTGMLINITKMVNKSVLDYIENKIVDKQILKKQKTEVLKSNKKTKEVLHGKITLPSIKTVGKINNAGTKTFILKFKTPPFGSRGKVGLKINGKEYHPYWNSTWSNRKKIILTGTSSGSQTDYQLLLNITYEPEMNPDFSDIRFCNDTDQLSAWLESKVNESYALIWVKFPHTPTNGETEDYWMYYGNSEASACWDGEATFEFFDDFEDGNYDGWSVIQGTYEINAGNLRKTNTGYGKIQAESNSMVSIWEADIRVEDITNNPLEMIFIYVDDNNYMAYGYWSDSIKLINKVGGSVTYPIDMTYTSDTAWHKIKVRRDGYGNYEIWLDDVSKGTATSTDITTSNYIQFYNWHFSGRQQRYDNISVRKYASSEPTYTFGTEQYYVDSIYFNSSNPYYNLIDYKGDIAVNHSYYLSDDLEWTASALNNDTGLVVTSMGSSEIDFTTYEGILDWLQLVNLDNSKIYTLQNSSGDLEEHQASGNAVNFTTDLSPDDYEIEITDAVSPTPTPEPSPTTLHDIKMSDKSIKEMYYPFMYILFIVIIIGGFVHVFSN